MKQTKEQMKLQLLSNFRHVVTQLKEIQDKSLKAAQKEFELRLDAIEKMPE